MKPIYGTTITGTEAILDMWLSGQHDKAIRELVLHISVNRPEMPHNTPYWAKNTIEKWIEDNFENNGE